jgi:transketolase
MRKSALDSIYQLALEDERVVFIGSDLGYGVMSEMKKNIPNRFFMEGISEQHIIGMAAGLAMDGFIPFVNTIGTFLTRRCYEQIAIDVALHNLPVRLIGNGGGGVYAPLGPTHMAIEDMVIMKAIPNMTVVAPCDALEMKDVIKESINWPHPMYIRVAKGGDEIVSNKVTEKFSLGIPRLLKFGEKGLFISTGVMTQYALKAADILEKEGVFCSVLHMPTIKPINVTELDLMLMSVTSVVTVEEGLRAGGLGSTILEHINDRYLDSSIRISRIGIPDAFSEQYGSQSSMHKYWGITVENIVKKMKDQLDV